MQANLDAKELVIQIKTLKKLSDSQFRRKTGVKRKTFRTMVKIVAGAYNLKKAQAKGPGGRPPKLGESGN